MKKTFFEISIIIFISCLFLFPLFIGKVMFPSNIYRVIPLYQNIKNTSQNGKTITQGDVLENTFPWAKEIESFFRNGYAPLWQFQNLAGMPLLGNDQSHPFFPLEFPLFFITSPVAAVNISALLEIITMAIGGYLLISIYTKNSTSKILGALIIALNGFTTGWLLWPLVTVLCIFPYILWLIEKIMRSEISKRKIVILSAIFTAFIGLAGNIEITLILLFASSIFLISIMIRDRKLKIKNLFFLLLGIILGALISSIQLYPAIIDLLRSFYFHFRTASNAYDEINAM